METRERKTESYRECYLEVRGAGLAAWGAARPPAHPVGSFSPWRSALSSSTQGCHRHASPHCPFDCLGPCCPKFNTQLSYFPVSSNSDSVSWIWPAFLSPAGYTSFGRGLRIPTQEDWPCQRPGKVFLGLCPQACYTWSLPPGPLRGQVVELDVAFTSYFCLSL